jgi:hypothetical protein
MSLGGSEEFYFVWGSLQCNVQCLAEPLVAGQMNSNSDE